MKKYICFILIVFVASCVSDTSEMVKEKHADGAPKLFFHYLNGIKTSEVEYFESGNKKSKCDFRDTIQHGRFTYWFENGVISFEGNYVNGTKGGIVLEYFEDGTKYSESLYENEKFMTCTKYHNNGKKKVQLDGKTDKIITWYRNGQLRAEVDNLHGEIVEFYEDGSLLMIGNIREGKADSIWRYMDKDGKLIKEVNYLKDVAIDSVLY